MSGSPQRQKKGLEKNTISVQTREREIYIEHEQKLKEQFDATLQNAKEDIKSHYENLLTNAKTAIDAANDQRKSNTEHFEGIIAKISLERNDMKLQCDKDIIRSRHQMHAMEEKLKSEIMLLGDNIKVLKEERDKIVGQLHTSEELADGRAKEIERLHMKHEETVDRLHQKHAKLIKEKEVHHERRVSMLCEEKTQISDMLLEEKESHDETKVAHENEKENLKKEHEKNILEATNAAKHKVILMRSLPNHRRFSMITNMKAPPPPPPQAPPHPTDGMAPYERTIWLIENSADIKNFMRAHAMYGSSFFKNSTQKSIKYNTWRIKRRNSLFAATVEEDKLNMLVWGIFHYYTSSVQSTYASSMGLTTLKRFIKDCNIPINSHQVDILFTKRCSNNSSTSTKDFNGSGSRALLSSPNKNDRGHDKRLEYDEFLLVVCDIAEAIYSHYDDDIHELFRVNLIPRCEKLGKRVESSHLHHDVLKLIKTAKSFTTILSLLGHNKKIFLHLSRFYGRIANASKRYGRGTDFNRITFDGILILSRDFEVVPKICSMSELQHVFHHTATNEHADKLHDTSSQSQNSTTGFSILHENVATFFLGVSIATTDSATKILNQPKVGVRMRLRGARKNKQTKLSITEGLNFRDEDNWTEELLSHRYILLLQCMNNGRGFQKLQKRKGRVPTSKFWFMQ